MTTTNTNIDVRRGATSASNAAADAACPGRHVAQKGLPDSVGQWAESGRKIHAALATDIPPHTLSLAEREVFDACREIEKKLLLQYFGDKLPHSSTGQQLRAFREQRYWARFAKDGQQYEHSGQADVVFRAGTRALIADYKTLAGDLPDSPKNLQLRDLAVLVKGNLIPTDEVGVVIIQPFVTHSPTLCVYSKDDLAKSEIDLLQRVIASNNPASPRIPGELQCEYCRAKASCAAYAKWAESQLPVPLPIVGKPMAAWTGEDCAVFCDGLAVAQKWLDEGKDFVRQKLEADGNAIPGWRLKPGAVRETINNPQGVFDRFFQLGGKLERFMVCVSVGTAKLKEALNEVTGAKGQALDKALKTLTDGMVEQKQTAPSLCRVEKEAKP